MIIVGAQKAGTSFLHHILRQHPNIATARKEGHILDWEEYYKQPRLALATTTFNIDACQMQLDYKDFFAKHVRCSHPHQPFSVFLEKSPAYIVRSNVIPDRLACVFPKPVQLVVLLRDPSKRAYSHYQMMLRFQANRNNSRMIEPERAMIHQLGIYPGGMMTDNQLRFDAWDTLLRSNYMTEAKQELWFPNLYILSRGLYALQLSQWIETLSSRWGMTKEELVKKYLFILDNDDLIADPQAVLNRLLEFSGSLPLHSFDLQAKSSQLPRVDSQLHYVDGGGASVSG